MRGVLLAALLAGCTPPAPAPSATSELKVLTGLPLLFAEGFSLDAAAHPVADALETRFNLAPIAASEAAQLGDGGMLLMAQPRAQTAENLVALDGWVRRGGRLLLLADPDLRWHSDKPLGDVTRPPLAFADTGLLTHWGLTLGSAPPSGPVQMRLGGRAIMGVARGALAATGPDCVVRDDGLAADCRIGKGRVTVIADADWLDLGPDGFDGPTGDNVPALLAELERLAR